MTQIVPVSSVTPQFIAQLNDNFKALSGAISSVPVDVASFGAKGDGVTNDLAAFNAAVASVSAAGGGILRAGAGTFRLDGQVLWKNGVFLEGSGKGATVLDFSQKSGFSNSEGVVLAADGGVSNAVSVTGDVGRGDTAIPVGSVVGFAPNDYVQIRSTETAYGEATKGETAQVQWADSGYIYLKHPLTYDYTVSGNTVEVVKVTTNTGGISKLTIKGKGPNPAGYPSPTYTGTPNESLPGADHGDYGLDVRWGRDWKVDDVHFIGVENSAIRLFGCIGTQVVNSFIDFDSINQLFQYGVSIFGACKDTLVQNNRFTNGRHSVTTNSSTLVDPDYEHVRGMPVGVLIDGNISTGTWVYGIDSHRAGSDIIISNNIVSGVSGGILIRAPRTKVVGNTVRLPNISTPGITMVHGIASYFVCDEQEIVDNTISGGSIGIYVSPTTRGRGMKIQGNNISNTRLTPISVNRVDGLDIFGNTCRDPLVSVTARIDVTDCTGGNILGNIIPVGAPGTIWAIYVRATTLGASNDINVAGNAISKTGSGSVTGIVFQNNVQNSTIGFNQTKTCTSARDAGTDASNTVLISGGASYKGQLTVASGIVTVDNWTTAFAVDTEGGAGTDDLDTINGGVTGQVVTIWGVTGSRVVTAKDGSGLHLNGDFAFTSTSSTLTLIKKSTIWIEVSRSANA